jgi:hypothetical protein
MIRFALAQFRTQALAAFAALLALAVLLAITKSSYDTAVAGCGTRGNCSSLTTRFLNSGDALVPLIALVVILVPAVIGIFWGAPLVAREIETGTFRLAWTQSVTRTRWMAVKLGVGALASMVVAAICSLMVTWWFSPIDRMNMNQFSVFDQRDIVPIGYAAFAFVFGVTAGVLIRRTVPAMAATLVAFVGARLAMTYWAGPHLFAPAVTSMALRSANGFGLGPAPRAPPRSWSIIQPFRTLGLSRVRSSTPRATRPPSSSSTGPAPPWWRRRRAEGRWGLPSKQPSRTASHICPPATTWR